MYKQIFFLATVLAVLGFSSASRATVVVDNTYGGQTQNNGITWTNVGNNSWRVWDSFTINNDVTFNSLDYWTLGNLQFGASVNLSIGTAANQSNHADLTFGYSDIDITPATTGSDQRLSVDFADITLSAGTYWLAFSGSGMYGSRAVSGENLIQIYQSGTFVETRSNAASLFTLSNTSVPAPSVLALLLLGLAGIGAGRLSRKTRS